MPVYNGENFLRIACDSILAQTFTDFELVISDNGSTDATEAICREYAARDPRVHYYRSAKNRGGSWNRNRVFALSRGELFMWHDHDDAILPTFLERCVAILDARPEVVNCYANTIIIDEHGAAIRHYAEGAALRSTSPYARLRHYIRHDRGCPLCSIYFGLMRRATLAQTPLFQPYIDAELSLMSELALRGQFHEIPDHLFLHRDHPGISTRRYATTKDRIAWSDPAKVGRAGGDGWRILAARLRAITIVPMPPYDRLRCFAYTAELFKHLAAGSAKAWLSQFRKETRPKSLPGLQPGSPEQIAAARR
jgi:glycosyltransferase involved in cell wall biosynthesis